METLKVVCDREWFLAALHGRAAANSVYRTSLQKLKNLKGIGLHSLHEHAKAILSVWLLVINENTACLCAVPAT